LIPRAEFTGRIRVTVTPVYDDGVVVTGPNVANSDRQQRDRAVARLVTLGGLTQTQAAELVDAAVAGAVDQAFELINGSSAVPTSMAAAKADQLRFICDRAGRMLSQREVEILFRVTARSARSIVTTMLASYEEALHEKFLARMRDDAKVIATGTDDAGLSWTLRFSESSTLDAAWGELTRLGLIADADVNATRRTITLPRTVTRGSKKVKPLDELGLAAPG
jgi:hypothetical protein